MLAKIKMELEGEGLNINMGSLFHGYMMRKIDSAFAEYFHHNSTNPFTSCVYKEKDSKKFFWKITTYNKKAYDMIVPYFLEDKVINIYLENKNLEVTVKSFSLVKTSFEDLYLNEERKNKLNLITPTSFKSDGYTRIFPNISTLMMGVINKINHHSDTVKLEDEKIISEFLEKVYIHDYNLRTQVFHLEKVKVKGFIGSMNLGITENNPVLINMLNFLIHASEYTGLGIKTALGMGGIEIG